jgi:multiple sugar transport system permease protein
VSSINELRRPRGPQRGARQQNKAAFLFLLPWFVGLFGITIGPMVASLFLSFTDYNLLQPPELSGFDNWTRMLHDERLHKSLGVTFTYVLVSIPLQLALALGLALLLDKGVRGLSFYRSVFYLPSLIGGSVAIAVLWRTVFGTDGLVNDALAIIGIQGQGWISEPGTALSTLVVLNVWTFGSPMVIFLAGLRQVPTSLYEAASVDGANRWRQFISITLPLLTPIIFFNLVLQIIHAFQTFTQAFVVSGGRGGPADSTLFYSLYLYERGFGHFDMGYASALAWLLLIIVAVFTAINFWASKYWVFYND